MKIIKLFHKIAFYLLVIILIDLFAYFIAPNLLSQIIIEIPLWFLFGWNFNKIYNKVSEYTFRRR